MTHNEALKIVPSGYLKIQVLADLKCQCYFYKVPRQKEKSIIDCNLVCLKKMQTNKLGSI